MATSANTQAVTLADLQELLDLSTLLLVEGIEENLRKSFNLPSKKVTLRDTELQSLNNIELLNGEEKVEGITQTKAIVESEMEDFQNEEKSLKGFNVYKKDKLREITPESLKQQDGKLPRNVGVFKISKIRNGTLQFLYKNGLFNLIKENFPVRREQHCEPLLIQLKSQEFGQIKRGGGLGFKKKVRKKARRKWKWKKNDSNNSSGNDSLH